MIALSFGLFLREISDYNKLLGESNKTSRKLVFYSERGGDYQYFEGYINYVLEQSELDVCYITSDHADPILHNRHPRIKSFYINLLIVSAITRLDSRVLVMTMPDLNRGHIRRSSHGVNHVYVFHGVGSTHLLYHKHAFDAYDTIFCIGPYDYREIRKAEEVYGLKAKNLVSCGYYRIEKIYRDYQKRAVGSVSLEPCAGTVLVAPSWHSGNILESCIDLLIAQFMSSPYRVIIRPHPEFAKRKQRMARAIARKIKGLHTITLDASFDSNESILASDILITDWSGIAYEYAFGTERPVLFITTECKFRNPDYKELGLEPIEFTTRERIGKTIDRAGIDGIQHQVRALMAQREEFRENILQCRSELLYNWLSSERVGGEYLISLCRDPVTQD